MPGRVCRRYPEGLGGEIKWNGKNAEVIRALNLKPIEDGRRLGRSDQAGINQPQNTQLPPLWADSARLIGSGGNLTSRSQENPWRVDFG
jgi:hypothetical protein